MIINQRTEWQKAIRKNFELFSYNTTYQEFVLYCILRFQLTNNPNDVIDIDEIYNKEIKGNANSLINKEWEKTPNSKKFKKEITKPWDEVFN